jgi:methionyl-tRNA synthetase
VPVGKVSEAVLSESRNAILEYERHMSRFEFHAVMNVLDTYIRGINKYWSATIKAAEDAGDAVLREQLLVDAFHMVRTATVLVHPIAPEGAEMIREYLNLGEEFWNWDRIFDTVYDFMADPKTHELKFLEPRVDFFKKHPSQLG